VKDEQLKLLSNFIAHVDAVIFETKFNDISWGEGFVKYPEMGALVEAIFDKAFERQKLEFPSSADRVELSQKFKSYCKDLWIQELILNDVIKVKKTELASTYYKFSNSRFRRYLDKAPNDNEALKLSREIGKIYLQDAFASLDITALDEIKFDEVGEGQLHWSSQSQVEIPASDRIVALDHNQPQYLKIKVELEDVKETLRGLNDTSLTEEEKTRLLAGINSAQILWDSLQLKVVQIRVGIIMAVEEISNVIAKTSKGVSVALIVDGIKSYIKDRTGIDF